MQTQQFILAELVCRRGENAGLVLEAQGLRSENTLLKTWLDREIVRGDKLEQIDKNSQRMDTNALTIQRDLENQNARLRDEKATLTDDLRSCQTGQKYIAGIGFGVGTALGYYLRGRTDSFINNRQFGMPVTAFRPMQQQQFELPSVLRPAKDYLPK